VSRSFVLAALRALHVDPNYGPPTQNTGWNETKTTEPTLYGGPQHR
jgi:hypothetical protein